MPASLAQRSLPSTASLLPARSDAKPAIPMQAGPAAMPKSCCPWRARDRYDAACSRSRYLFITGGCTHVEWTTLLSAADHRTARRRRGQSPAGGAGRAHGVARRRQRGRRGGRDGADAGGRRADDVGSRRRRVLHRLRRGERARDGHQRHGPGACAPRRRSAMPPASRVPGRCRSRCRGWWPGSA